MNVLGFFPLYHDKRRQISIEIGLTTTGDSEARVNASRPCYFEFPISLQTWEVPRIAAVEDTTVRHFESRAPKIMQFVHPA